MKLMYVLIDFVNTIHNRSPTTTVGLLIPTDLGYSSSCVIGIHTCMMGMKVCAICMTAVASITLRYLKKLI